MQEPVLISDRGQITLPASTRKKYALDSSSILLLEETPDGILLRKAGVIPLRTYTAEAVQDFLKDDKILPRDKKWLK
jgi:AbrB family looped-hinge helix DNA binding protein